MAKVIFVVMFTSLSAVMWGTAALAFSLDLVPNSPIAVQGNPLEARIDINLKETAGVPPSVGAFDIEVQFDSAILMPRSVIFGPFLGNADLFEALTTFSFSPGLVRVAEVSLLAPAALDLLQLQRFTLATLLFTASASGTTMLNVSQDTVLDAFGNPVTGGFHVAEPSSMLLVGSGLAGLAAVAWRNHRT